MKITVYLLTWLYNESYLLVCDDLRHDSLIDARGVVESLVPHLGEASFNTASELLIDDKFITILVGIVTVSFEKDVAGNWHMLVNAMSKGNSDADEASYILKGYRADMALNMGADPDKPGRGYPPEVWAHARKHRASDIEQHGMRWIAFRDLKNNRREKVFEYPVDPRLPIWEVGDKTFGRKEPAFWVRYAALTPLQAAELHVSHDGEGRNWTLLVRPYKPAPAIVG